MHSSVVRRHQRRKQDKSDISNVAACLEVVLPTFEANDLGAQSNGMTEVSAPGVQPCRGVRTSE